MRSSTFLYFSSSLALCFIGVVFFTVFSDFVFRFFAKWLFLNRWVCLVSWSFFLYIPFILCMMGITLEKLIMQTWFSEGRIL